MPALIRMDAWTRGTMEEFSGKPAERPGDDPATNQRPPGLLNSDLRAPPRGVWLCLLWVLVWVWVWFGFGLALVWFGWVWLVLVWVWVWLWFGFDLGLIWFWFGFGLVLIWLWVGFGLVWFWIVYVFKLFEAEI